MVYKAPRLDRNAGEIIQDARKVRMNFECNRAFQLGNAIFCTENQMYQYRGKGLWHGGWEDAFLLV